MDWTIRWCVPLVLAGCDPGVVAPVMRRALAACEAPSLEDPVQCQTPETLEAVVEAPINPGLASSPNLRSVAALVPAGTDQLVAVGTYGDFFAEGAFAVAIDPDEQVIWSADIPSASDVTAVAASGDAEGTWVAAAQSDGETIARRYDLTGAMIAEAVVADFAVESLQVQPAGAIAMTGTSAGNPAYVGLAVDGAELWNGATNQAVGPRVVVDGIAEYFDGPGAALWEHDPRGEPDPGFPLDIGFERAIIMSTGDVLAIGQALGSLGDNTLFVRLTPDGDPSWSVLVQRTLAEVVLEGPNGTEIIAGPSFHCTPGTYLGVFDATAV
ncbi:MAG TPA: hypothetical protein VFG69_21565, partial [Nannocystaceae bacterium]|nr:hypothetical protein [Nannocystaceae bacterium]